MDLRRNELSSIGGGTFNPLSGLETLDLSNNNLTLASMLPGPSEGNGNGTGDGNGTGNGDGTGTGSGTIFGPGNAAVRKLRCSATP